MKSLAPPAGTVTEDELAKHEAGINRLAWAGGIAVSLVTIPLLVLLLFTQAEAAWEYPLYILLGGIPFAYAVFCNFVLRGVQVSLLHRYQAELTIKLSELEEMAARDELTGLYNRRHFYPEIQRELSRAQTTRESLALLLLDLDGLKGLTTSTATALATSLSPTSGRSSSSTHATAMSPPVWAGMSSASSCPARTSGALSPWPAGSGKN
jgi:predicted signal transduction protein with EAL and GGDEF domain